MIRKRIASRAQRRRRRRRRRRGANGESESESGSASSEENQGQPISSGGGYGGIQPVSSSGGYGGQQTQPVAASGGYAGGATQREQPVPEQPVEEVPPPEEPVAIETIVQPAESGGYAGTKQTEENAVIVEKEAEVPPSPECAAEKVIEEKEEPVPAPVAEIVETPVIEEPKEESAEVVDPPMIEECPSKPVEEPVETSEKIEEVPAKEEAVETEVPVVEEAPVSKAPDPPIEKADEDLKETEKEQEKQPAAASKKFGDHPLPDPRPSVHTASPFTDETAHVAAKILQKAMKGMGSDELAMARVTGSHNHAQRLKIKQIFGTFGKKERRNLLKDLNSETSGEFRKLMMLCYAEPGAADAKWMKDALSGVSYNTEMLCEILLTRTNKQLHAMKVAWALIEQGSLKTRLARESSKLFSSGNFKTFVMKILEADRPSNEDPIDEIQLSSDAEYLNRMAHTGGQEAKSGFIRVMTERSWRHLHALSGKFQQISQKLTLEAAAKKALGDSDTGKGVITLIRFTLSPYDFFAKKLYDSMHGLGTRDSQLRRIILSRSEIDLASIAEVFGARHGKGKTLRSWIDSETKGANRHLLLALCGLDG